MAVPSDISIGRGVQREGSPTAETVVVAEFNKLVTQFRALLTAMDGDTGITLTTYSATYAGADSASPAKVTLT